ncbi:MAG: hypothetical protein KAS32_11150 [Candidatus Peribacteraceae bacterium]|nr:hypothetical protein [Candidatus Peribacteraceae bacterium]
MRKEICINCIDNSKAYEKEPLYYIRSTIETTFIGDKSKAPTFCPRCMPFLFRKIVPNGYLDALYEKYTRYFCVTDKDGELFKPVAMLEYRDGGTPPYCPFFIEHNGDTLKVLNTRGIVYERTSR